MFISNYADCRLWKVIKGATIAIYAPFGKRGGLRCRPSLSFPSSETVSEILLLGINGELLCPLTATRYRYDPCPPTIRGQKHSSRILQGSTKETRGVCSTWDYWRIFLTKRQRGCSSRETKVLCWCAFRSCTQSITSITCGMSQICPSCSKQTRARL